MTEKEALLSRQKIAPGEIDTLREWFAGEAKNKEAVRAALRDEGVYVESVFIHSTDDGEYLLYYIEADDFDEALEEFMESEHENIQQYQEVVEQTLVGGLEAYHQDRSNLLLHAVVDPDGRRPEPDKDVLLSVDRVHEAHHDELLALYDDLVANPDEVQGALKEEGVITESAFLKVVDDRVEMSLYVESDDWERTQELYAESKRELDVRHRETLANALEDGGAELEPVFHVIAEPDG